MQENHEKTGFAAFIFALVGVLSLGLGVIPALICAVISKRQSEVAGAPTDGYATAAIVLSGFILAVWAAILLGEHLDFALILTGLGRSAITLEIVAEGEGERRIEAQLKLVHSDLLGPKAVPIPPTCCSGRASVNWARLPSVSRCPEPRWRDR